uniref:Bromo domain-containing protein n=1 Tax=Mesocestoides corti TaxID=53468 RepID=A0A5K3FRQ4_MESCO
MRNTVTWASNITHDSNSDKEEKRVEFEGEGNLFAEGVERELLRRKSTLSTELPAMLDRSKATSGIRHQVYEYDTRDCLLDEMCHRGASVNETEKITAGAPSKHQKSSTSELAPKRRSCLLKSKSDDVYSQPAVLTQPECRNATTVNNATQIEAELKALMERCKVLQCELERRSTSKDELGSVNDLGTSSAATASATDTATTTTTTTTVSPKKRHVSRHSSGKSDSHRPAHRTRRSSRNSQTSSGSQRTGSRPRHHKRKTHHHHSCREGDCAGTSLTHSSSRNFSYNHGHWPLTSHQAGYPIPSQPYANCGLSSLFYHAPPPPLTYQPAPPPPPPPPPLQPAYMPPPPVVIDAWGHHGCHSRRYSHRHKHRKSSKRLRHDSRCHKSKSSDSTGDSKKRSALNDQQTADRQIQDQTTQTNEVTRTIE